MNRAIFSHIYYIYTVNGIFFKIIISFLKIKCKRNKTVILPIRPFLTSSQSKPTYSLPYTLERPNLTFLAISSDKFDKNIKL